MNAGYKHESAVLVLELCENLRTGDGENTKETGKNWCGVLAEGKRHWQISRFPEGDSYHHRSSVLQRFGWNTSISCCVELVSGLWTSRSPMVDIGKKLASLWSRATHG